MSTTCPRPLLSSNCPGPAPPATLPHSSTWPLQALPAQLLPSSSCPCLAPPPRLPSSSTCSGPALCATTWLLVVASPTPSNCCSCAISAGTWLMIVAPPAPAICCGCSALHSWLSLASFPSCDTGFTPVQTTDIVPFLTETVMDGSSGSSSIVCSLPWNSIMETDFFI